MLEYIKKSDPDLFSWIQKELNRQQNGLEMIPSENFTSPSVMEALGSILTNKYSEGYPGKRYYGGNHYIDEIENLARERAKKLFGVEYANVQAYSGSPANQAVYFALLEPGDKVLGMELAQGGHLTHGYKLNFSGRYYHTVNYGVNPESHLLDYDAIRDVALKEKPKLIICGATAYPRIINFTKFRQIAEEVGAYLLADISHIAALVIGGQHPSPVPSVDVIMTTTHKTLRGPRGAIIMAPKITDRLHDKYHPNSKKNLGEMIDSAIIPGLQGGPHNHQTAGIAICLKEATTPSFQQYAEQIVKNSRSLAETLITGGLKLITGGTDNHLILVDVTNLNLTGQLAQDILDEVGITVNKNMIPYDQRKPLDPSGIRLGTPALTTRGFKEDAMKIIGQLIADVLKKPDNSTTLNQAKQVIIELTKAHPLYSPLE